MDYLLFWLEFWRVDCKDLVFGGVNSESVCFVVSVSG